MKTSSTNSSGISFLGALAILFIGLKLGGVINWSYWWVLSPLWIPATLVLLSLFCVFILAVLMAIVNGGK